MSADKAQMSALELMAYATKLEDQLNLALAALQPFADNAEGWTRVGMGPNDQLVEAHWKGGPEAVEGEPEYLDATFLNVGHLIVAQTTFQLLRAPTTELAVDLEAPSPQ
jgi:hypothetical protein